MNFKTPKIISQKIRSSAKGEDCSLRIPGVCNHDNNTVVFAHLNTRFKGIGNKSPDIFGVYACSECHTALDQNLVNKEDQLRGLTETQMKLYAKGLICVK